MLVLYYDSTAQEKFVSSTNLTSISDNVVSKTTVQKKYTLRNSNEEIKGRLDIIDNSIIFSETPSTTDLFSNYVITLECTSGKQVYSVVYSSVIKEKESVILYLKLTSVSGKSCFKNLKWEIPYVDGKPLKRILTFT